MPSFSSGLLSGLTYWTLLFLQVTADSSTVTSAEVLGSEEPSLGTFFCPLEHYVNQRLFFLLHDQSPAMYWWLKSSLCVCFPSLLLFCKKQVITTFSVTVYRWLFTINFNLTFIEAQFLFPPYEVLAKCKDSESSYSYSFLIMHTKTAIQVESVSVRNWHWPFFFIHLKADRQSCIYVLTPNYSVTVNKYLATYFIFRKDWKIVWENNSRLELGRYSCFILFLLLLLFWLPSAVQSLRFQSHRASSPLEKQNCCNSHYW